MGYRQGTWAHDYTHFERTTDYNTVIVWINENGRVYQLNYSNKTSEKALADRVVDLKGGYYNNGLRRCSYLFLNRDTFNGIVQALKNNTDPGKLSDHAQGITTVSTLKDKNVYIVWNKTTATFVKAVETEAEALTTAKDSATKNTNQAFLVLRPDSVAYQPVSITVDKL